MAKEVEDVISLISSSQNTRMHNQFFADYGSFCRFIVSLTVYDCWEIVTVSYLHFENLLEIFTRMQVRFLLEICYH